MTRRARCALSLLALALTAALALPAGAVADRDRADRDVTVMTRNIYLGGNIVRPLNATAGLSGLPALIAFGNANHTLRAIVDETDFPARAKLLAKEIADTEPDLIGLQEVALWRSGPLDLANVGVADATTVDYDFLEILLDELAARGERYATVSVQEESDVEGPAFSGNPFTGAGFNPATARDARLTMHDVILRRVATRDMKILASGSAQYDARIDVSIAGVGVSFIRGYNWADVKLRGRTFRFVNTHLESQSSLVALTQASELLQGPAAAGDKPVVVVCDCNSDPLDARTKPIDPIPTPHFAPYRLLTDQGGLTDEWLALPGDDPGFTAGLTERVNDPTAARIDHRIDLVLSRGGFTAEEGVVVGTDPANRTAGGLWPSDHAGVVVKLGL